MNIFEIMYDKYKITKPIRLIELFGGYGSQHFALEYLGANFEHWKLVEWAVKSIQAYKDAHYQNDNTDYSKDLTKEQLIDYLYNKHISMDYNEPMELEQIKRKDENWLRTVYNNIQATKNIVDIMNTKASDLEIVDTDKYEYIMTYSFPCQDLSLAGLGKGMARDSGTRSGMLWQVERILDECENLPQILLMENVPEVKGTNNVKFFNEWQSKLESLGYKNYHQNLIATDYGIPQTRNRTFMISILGNYSYTFPNAIPLKLKLKDMLENDVDEKYYLSDAMLKYMVSESSGGISRKAMFERNFEKGNLRELAATITTASGQRPSDNFILTKDTENYIEWQEKGKLDIDCRAFKDEKVMSTIMTSPKNKVLENSDNMKTQLCNKLIQDGIVQENDVIKHSYTDQIMSGDKKCIEMNNVMPTITTRPDCLGVVVKEATKQGYAIANEGDSINISQPNSKTRRGRVGKGVAQTLLTQPEQVVIGTYNFSASDNFMHGKDRLNVNTDVMQTILTSPKIGVVGNNLRIRKLTPKECFRLMGVKDEDYERIAINQSDSSLYHLAGDSIVVNVLEAIFKELL